jgi:hypothetical protein
MLMTLYSCTGSQGIDCFATETAVEATAHDVVTQFSSNTTICSLRKTVAAPQFYVIRCHCVLQHMAYYQSTRSMLEEIELK